MPIRLEEVYNKALPDYQIKLIAGEGGLRNHVEWVHVIEDEQVSGFLRGNELVFTTGIGHVGSSWLNIFVPRLKEHGACGLVVNLGRHIMELPAEVVSFCREAEFPLFTIPWEVRIVDMSRYICHMIVEKEQTEISVSNAFRNAIFFPDQREIYEPQLERFGYRFSRGYCVAAVSIRAKSAQKQEASLESLVSQIQRMFSCLDEKYSIFVQDDHLLIIFVDFQDELIRHLLEKFQANFTNGRVSVGVSDSCQNLGLLAKCYKQALAALDISEKKHMSIVYYRDMGVYKLLLQVDDKEALHSAYYDILGKLDDYDRLNATDYVKTLRCYLEQSGSVQAVADMTYVHRNTVNYKLRKIKEIIGLELVDTEERMWVWLALKIKDIL